MTLNTKLYDVAARYLGTRCPEAKLYCGLSSGDPYCNAFVCFCFHKADCADLYYGGKKVTYCPTSIKWCQAHLAQLPLFMAMKGDVIYFDWNKNGIPDHSGFVRERVSTSKINTLEGNTDGGIVAYKTRPAGYVLGIFRPHFKPASIDTSKPIKVDGEFNYKSIAMLQKALKIKVDSIFGRATLKALQKAAGCAQDAVWSAGTSRAIQRMLHITEDGEFGVKSVKALQQWCNDQVFDNYIENGRKILATLKAESTLELMTTRVVQAMTIAKGLRYVFYASRDGQYQTIKAYNDEDLTGIINNYSGYKLGHCNGATYANGKFYVCAYYGKKNTKILRVLDSNLKIIDTIKLPVAVSGIAYADDVFYGSKGSTLYVFKNWKVSKKFSLKKDGTAQDIAAYKGHIYSCRSYVKGSTSYIDKFTITGVYVGSYKITADELESCAIDADGCINYCTWNKARLIRTGVKA